MPERTATDISMVVNGQPVRANVEPRRHLGDFLREDLGLTGTHIGCEHGVCGACSVVVDGLVVRSCLTLVVQTDGSIVETIEHHAQVPDPIIDALKSAFIERNALQCGFCTPAMLLTAAEYIREGGENERHKIRAHLSGNYCRCTGYHAIVDAIGTAISRLGSLDRQVSK